MSPRRTSKRPSDDNGMIVPSGFTPASVTVKLPAVKTNWLLTRVVFALVVLPPIVAAPDADSVFTRDGGSTCFFDAIVVVVVLVVVVLIFVAATLGETNEGTVVVVLVVVEVVEATLLSTKVNSDVRT